MRQRYGVGVAADCIGQAAVTAEILGVVQDVLQIRARRAEFWDWRGRIGILDYQLLDKARGFA